MKYLIVFALVIFAACNLQAELTEKGIMEIKLKCKDELGVTTEDLKELRKNSVTSSKIRCFIDCTYTKTGVMNGQSRINKAVAKQYIALGNYTTANLTALIDTCSAIKVNEDGCFAAPQYRQCFKDGLLELKKLS